MPENNLVYTNTFKTVNVDLESDRLQLSDFSFIEKSDSFATFPDASILPYLISQNADLVFIHPRFSEELFSSPTRVRVFYTQEDAETNPFGHHECSYIAFTLAILCDGWFFTGGSEFYNNKRGSPSFALHANYFSGEGPCLIKKADETLFVQAYTKIYEFFSDRKNKKTSDIWLLFIGIKCIAKLPIKQFSILNHSFNHIFNDWHELTLNAAIFYEAIFSVENPRTHTIKKNVLKWNDTFPAFNLDESFIEVVMNHRHYFTHYNASNAKTKVDRWRKEAGDNCEELLRNEIVKTAKIILRAFILEYEKFKEFNASLSD